MHDYETLPQMMQFVVNEYRNSKSLNYLYLKHWEKISTERFVEQVRQLALGLKKMGIKPGDGVGIIAQPSPYWVMMDMAIMLNKAISVPMFPNISSENFDYQIDDSNVKTLYIESDEILEEHLKSRLSTIKNVISFSVHTQGDNVSYFQDLIEKGDALSNEQPLLFGEMRDAVQPDDIATIIYTSGSTGVPKGVEISHKNLVHQIKAAGEIFPLDPSKDVALTCLPLAHVFERMIIYFYISQGVSVYFADDIKRVGDLLREIRPTIITVVPRILEKVFAKMTAKIDDAKGLKKFLLSQAIQAATKNEPGVKTLMSPIYQKLVYSKMLEALGNRLEYCVSGGAPLNKEIGTFFLNIGLNIYEGYGLTEASPVLATNYPGHNKIGTVGITYPGVELKITERGELLARGDNIMIGYHNKKDDTDDVLDKDGWLSTGDKASFDDEGYLTITGRIKELFKTSGGKYVSPIPIEQALSKHRLVDQALVVAEGRRFVSALLFPDYENAVALKEYYGQPELSDDAFFGQQKIQDKMEHMVKTMNQNLSHSEHVQKVKFIPYQLSIQEGDLTPKMNLRRNALYTRFDDIIHDFYEE